MTPRMHLIRTLPYLMFATPSPQRRAFARMALVVRRVAGKQA